MKVDSYGFAAAAYKQIIVIRDEKAFFEILAANPHMEAIVGADEETRENFPGVYIAGIKSRLHRDNMARNCEAT